MMTTNSIDLLVLTSKHFCAVRGRIRVAALHWSERDCITTEKTSNSDLKPESLFD